MPAGKALPWRTLGRYSVVGVLLGLAILAACGGGSDPALQVTVEPGKVTCEPLSLFKAYRYHSIFTTELGEINPSLSGTDPYTTEGFKITFDIDGVTQGSDRVAGVISYPVDNSPNIEIVSIGETYWVTSAGQTFEEQGPRPALYEPARLCESLAPDIDLSGLTGEPETVGDVQARKYSFDSLPSEFTKRSGYFGASSDAGRLIDEVDVDIWVADEGGYIVRMDMTGTGAYENGRAFTIRLFYELADINSGSIQIVPPV